MPKTKDFDEAGEWDLRRELVRIPLGKPLEAVARQRLWWVAVVWATTAGMLIYFSSVDAPAAAYGAAAVISLVASVGDTKRRKGPET